jgi:hypothetical protein
MFVYCGVKTVGRYYFLGGGRHDLEKWVVPSPESLWVRI